MFSQCALAAGLVFVLHGFHPVFAWPMLMPMMAMQNHQKPLEDLIAQFKEHNEIPSRNTAFIGFPHHASHKIDVYDPWETYFLEKMSAPEDYYGLIVIEAHSEYFKTGEKEVLRAALRMLQVGGWIIIWDSQKNKKLLEVKKKRNWK